jgi:putative ABC transport system permease protein
MDTVLKDLRYSVRSLLKSPIFTLVSLLVLAIGIGANSAIFSIVNGVLLRPLPYESPERLVMIWGDQAGKGKDTVVPADFLDWRKQSRSFSELAGYAKRPFSLTGGDVPELLDGLSVTGNFFRTLGVQPILGRDFQADPASNERGVVILSHGLWKQQFAGDPGVLNQKIILSGAPYTIVGVLPPTFNFHEESKLYVRAGRDVPELGMDVGGDPATLRGLSYMRAIGRLDESTSPEQAKAEMVGIARQQAELYPDTNSKRSVMLIPLQKEVVGEVDKALVVLLGAVSLVLLIACTNVANLFFARATDRQREITLRVALGASRRHLLQQLITESVVLSLLAGCLGLLLGVLATRVLLHLSPGNIPRLNEVGLDGRVLAFTLSVSVLTGLLCGLLPLLQLRKFDLVGALKESGSKATDSVLRRRLRSTLVVSEVALAVVLLLGAGLMIRSFANLRQIEPGFDPSRLLTFRIALPPDRYADEVQQAAFFQRTLELISTQPGVVHVATVLTPPVGGDSINLGFEIEGKPRPESQTEQRDGLQAVSPGYFETMAIKLLQGRTFSASDSASSPRVVVLSREMARRYWQDANPVGSRISFGSPNNPNRKWYTVVGVVEDVRHEGPSGGRRAETYVSNTQWPWPFMSFVVRTSGDPLALVGAVRRSVQEVDPAQPITAVHTMEELLSGSVARPRFTSFLLGAFAGVALLLAAIGLYGVMAYTVAQRTPEIGIKMALGAQRGKVMGEVLRYALVLTAIGIGLGLLAAQPLMGMIKALLFGVGVTDRGTLLIVPAVLLLSALLATFVPAWRASRIDPLTAIKRD